MLFSVIIPTYNRESYLRETLASVWQQTHKDYELIIVDDGSTDGTKAYADSLEGRATFIQQSNAGPGVARNRGAEVAKGEYLAFLDSDDLWFPWTLEITAGIIESAKRPSFISGKIISFTEAAELKKVPDKPLEYKAHRDYLTASDRDILPFVGSCAMVVRRDTLLVSGGFSQRNLNAEDHDLALRMGLDIGFVEILSPATVGYRRHTTNMTQSLVNNVKGTLRLLEQERAGAYPGGTAHLRSRRRILGSHLRPVAIACARQGLQDHAWELYRKTFLWHLSLFRLKFLLGFPLITLRSMLARKRPSQG
jgi:glycosyltransferase involved in cell wall biosynthesis